MKGYESTTELHLSADAPAILRLDGHSFSKSTAPFNKPFDNAIDSSTPPPPYFDGRIFNVSSPEKCVNNILWQCRGDATCNSVAAFALSLFSTKQLHCKHTDEMIEMKKQEKAIVYEDTVPKWALEGSMIKRVLVHIGAIDMKTGEKTLATRTKTRCEDRGMRVFSEGNVKLVTEKHWPTAKQIFL